MKKFICYFLIVSTLISSLMSFNFISVSADDSKDAQSTLGLSDEVVSVWKAVWDAYKSDGFSEVAIAGIFGNLKAESGLSASATENGGAGKGIGIAQWSTDANRTRLQEWSSKCGHSTVKVSTSDGNSYTICSQVTCQAAFLLTEIKGDWITNKISNYNATASTYPADGVPQGISVYGTFEEFKTASDIAGAAISMAYCYERSAMNNLINGGDPNATVKGTSYTNKTIFQHGAKTRSQYASLMYTCFTGTTIKPSDTPEGQDAAETVAEQLYASGYWTEDQLSAYCKLTEINIQELYLDGATREALTQDELSGLANWQLNVRMQEEEHGFIRFLRTLSMFIGIILVVWAMLFYTAYWIDKTNNILPIEFVFLLSFGKLRISGDENDSTYSFNSGSSAKVKMINHKDCIFICVIAVGAGFLLITGIFYSIVQGFVNKALQFLGRV